MVTFSVIVPVYNVAPFLRDCLDSVLRQSCPDWEIVAVDDGSTDGSAAILDEYAARDARIRVLHRPNGGVSSARNEGIAAARGRWIVFVDADDFVRESYFEDVASVAAGDPSVQLIGFGMMPYYGRETWSSAGLQSMTYDLTDEIPGRLALMSLCQFAYRRDMFGHLRFRPYRMGEDLVFTCETFGLAERCVVIDRQEYGYRYREGSATHSGASAGNLLDVVTFSREMFKVLAASGKSVGRIFTQGRGNEWIEALPKVILQFKREGGEGADRVWDEWIRSMADAADMPLFSGWQRFVARTVAGTRSKLAVRLLCLLPLWLKRKGFVKA